MSNSQTFEAEPFEIEATSTLPEAPSQPLLGCPDAVGDLGVLQSALALLTQRLNQSPLDRSRIHNARLDFVAAANQIIESAKGGGYVSRGCKKRDLLWLTKRVERLRNGLPAD